ncbi:MAG TPA: OB-fold nucleic acid binding domain-containing protein, partial [Candidatus Methylacidiphilales bacterium]
WDKDDCEDLGIIKIDILGLGMMNAMQDALELCRRRGHPVDLATIPKEDPATYDLICRADTVGLFQIESRAQLATIPRMQPRCFYDLAVQVGIVRPGPIVGDLKNPYLRRRCGEEPVTYAHPALEPVLERTLGVCMFQEQVLQVSMILADFSPTEADELRKSLGFTRSDERLDRVLALMDKRMEAKGIDLAVRDWAVKAAASFQLYGFPESHALSFALIAYGSAYLKAHYPVEFFTALLNAQPMGFYSPDTLIQDAKRHGVKFLPICVVESQAICSIDAAGAVRLGLNYVDGLHHARAKRIVVEREKQPFASLTDFIHRSGVTKQQRRLLAKIGALNAFSTHRRAALWESERVLDEDDLFARVGEGVSSPLAPMNRGERLDADYRGTGLTVGAHPMAFIRHTVPHLVTAIELETHPNGSKVTIGGRVICCQRPGTAKGICFISLTDETGISNAVVYPDLFEERRLVVSQEPFLEIEGVLQHIDGTLSVRASDVRALHSPVALLRDSYDFH